MGRYNSTRVDEEINAGFSLWLKRRHVQKWGRKRTARYVNPDLSYYWEGAREWCDDKKFDEEKKMLQRYISTP